MKKIASVLAIATILAAGAAAQTASPSTAQDNFSNIRNFFRVNEQICTGGQPSMENLQKMKEQGLCSVVNLRLASEYNFDEEATMAKTLKPKPARSACTKKSCVIGRWTTSSGARTLTRKSRIDRNR